MDNLELWQNYRGSSDKAVREKLLLIYLPLVKLVAGRIKQTLPQAVQLADLEGAGVRGLIQSVEGFDLDRGVRFESYASTRIRGAILDSLREYDWLPRSIRAKSKQLERAMEACEAKLGRIPDDEEVAAEMDLPLEEYQELLQKVGSLQIVSLDGEPGGAEGLGSFHEVIPDEDAQDPLERIEHEEEKNLVIYWLQELPEQMRRVMVLYYYEELTLKEIGEVLSLSESRICQIHSASIHSLRARLNPEQVA
ncbi:RNA polymerase sigma factor WhiG [candidate division LCP-89 bacterium B3_LCP]|uniref:RNA polymerase sigma factor WhiG n=1 Tax=candidate division LCP-89 bacterium B3_LCP TaxID=2012998 RepID=A0A532V4Z4_UNCL8|nr:MAG: RNA polymerase sigma factor WhiG [candidate division LCP-89 bacterium B3_LCP]